MKTHKQNVRILYLKGSDNNLMNGWLRFPIEPAANEQFQKFLKLKERNSSFLIRIYSHWTFVEPRKQLHRQQETKGWIAAS